MAMQSYRAPQKAEQGEVTLFDKIVSKQIPATILYEDETALAFKYEFVSWQQTDEFAATAQYSC